jgi:uncharacterized membrane protein (UPF0136 family)
VVAAEGNIEIRRYEPYLLAETFVDGAFESAGNEGFRRLFRYITGANTARSEISMTAPVSQQAAGASIAMTAPVAQTAQGEGFWVAFVVPSSFTTETVPRPTDSRVRIRPVPAQFVAVARYSGFWGEARYLREEEKLRDAITRRGLSADGMPQFARYNPPYMPPFMRRNEILIPLAATTPGALVAERDFGQPVAAL